MSQIREKCPACQKELAAPAAFAGHLVQCKFCEANFWLPKQNDGVFKSCCQKCDRTLRIPRRYAGRSVQCSGCGHSFKVRLPHAIVLKKKRMTQEIFAIGDSIRRAAMKPESVPELPDDHVIL